MSNEMRIVKFETLISDVNEALFRTDNYFEQTMMKDFEGMMIEKYEGSYGHTKGCYNPSLLLIYDYDKLNDYGKVIMEQSRLYLANWYTHYWYDDSLTDTKGKIDAAKELVRHCRMDENRDVAYKFVFWTMMVLTVDKSDKEEHLSLICDFARMLKISDDEMMDILQVIKVLYHEAKEDYEFRSDTVPFYFENVLALYD